jgi:redox-regulated HSP33 family molecular chaperone
MKARVKSLAEYEVKTAENDCKWFLSNIQAITMQFDKRYHGYMSMINAIAGLVNYRQQSEQTVTSYLEALKSRIDNVEYHGGTLVLNLYRAPTTALDGRRLSEEERRKIARGCTLAASFNRSANCTRFGTIQTNLLNQYSNGKDEYPTDLTSYTILFLVEWYSITIYCIPLTPPPMLSHSKAREGC